MNTLSTQMTQVFWRVFKPAQVVENGVRFSTDPKFIPRKIRRGIFRGRYEAGEKALMAKALKPGDRVLEIGACVGYVSVHCAAIVGPQSLLVYEPNPRAADVLKHNFAINGWEANVRVRAVAAEAGPATFYFHDNFISSSLIDRNACVGAPVECDAFDAVLAEFRPTAILMDAEGGEFEILTQSQIVGVSNLVVELHPHIIGEDKVAELRQHLTSIGFALRDSDGGDSYWFQRAG